MHSTPNLLEHRNCAVVHLWQTFERRFCGIVQRAVQKARLHDLGENSFHALVSPSEEKKKEKYFRKQKQ